MELAINILWPLAAGAALGALFFGGLRWTVRRATASDRPIRLMLLSFAVRAAVAAGGFYALLMVRPAAMAIGVLGFVLARMAMLRAAAGPAKRRGA